MANKWLRQNAENRNGITFPYHPTQTMKKDYYGWSFWLRQQIGSSCLFSNLYREPFWPYDFKDEVSCLLDKDLYRSYGWQCYTTKSGNRYKLSIEYGCGTYNHVVINFDKIFNYIDVYHIYICLDMVRAITVLYVNGEPIEEKNNYTIERGGSITRLNGRLQSHVNSTLKIGENVIGPLYQNSSFYIDELSVYDGAQPSSIFLANLYNNGQGEKRTHANFLNYSGAVSGFYINFDDEDDNYSMEIYYNNSWSTAYKTVSYETCIEGGVPLSIQVSQNSYVNTTGVNPYVTSGYEEIVISNHESVNLNSSTFSIEMWLKTSATNIWVIKKHPMIGDRGQWWQYPGWTIGFNADGQIQLYGSDGDLTVSMRGSFSLNDNNWHHYVICKNSDTLEESLYIDGFKDENAVWGYEGYPTLFPNSLDLTISRVNIAGFAIYNTVLTDSFIRQRWNEGYGLKLDGDESGLQFGINCDEGFNNHLYNIKHEVPYGIASSHSVWETGGIKFLDAYKSVLLHDSSSVLISDTNTKNALAFHNSFTVSFWLKINEVPSAGNTVFAFNPSSYSTNGWRIRILPPIDPVYAPNTTCIALQAINDTFDLRSNVVPNICNGWHHYAFIYGHVYIDGIYSTNTNSPYPKLISLTSITNNQIESSSFNFTSNGNFEIDDFRVYWKNYSQNEIKAIYNNKIGTRPFTIDSYWNTSTAKGCWINFDKVRIIGGVSYFPSISLENNMILKTWHQGFAYLSGGAQLRVGGPPFHKSFAEEVYNMTAIGGVDNHASRGSYSGGFY